MQYLPEIAVYAKILNLEIFMYSVIVTKFNSKKKNESENKRIIFIQQIIFYKTVIIMEKGE